MDLLDAHGHFSIALEKNMLPHGICMYQDADGTEGADVTAAWFTALASLSGNLPATRGIQDLMDSVALAQDYMRHGGLTEKDVREEVVRVMREVHDWGENVVSAGGIGSRN